MKQMVELSGYVNGSKKPLTYLFKDRFKPQFSPTDQWERMSLKMNRVAADYVALDAQEPLKVRSSFGRYTGDLPKLGMSLILKESEMKRIRLMQQQMNALRYNAAQATDDAQALQLEAQAAQVEDQIIRIIYNDAQQCTVGVWESNEDVAHRLISTGTAVIADNDKPGYGLKLELELEDSQKVEVATSWGNNTDATVTKNAKTISVLQAQIERMREKGSVEGIVMDETTIKIIAGSDEGKQVFGSTGGRAIVNPKDLPLINVNAMSLALAEYFDLEEVVVVRKRGIIYEKDGEQKTVYPYQQGMVVLVPNPATLGTLWYGTVEESLAMEPGVNYTTVDNYTLVSIKRTGDPLQEKTRSQAVVIPMLDNIEQMCWINTRPTPVSGVTLNKSTTSIVVGATETLVATVAPTDASNKALVWASSAPAKATVDANGKVTAVATGSANITATSSDGTAIVATCAVTVTAS